MPNLILYCLCVLFWGLSWLAITFQLGSVPVEVSVAYRFLFSGGLLMAYVLARRLPLGLSARDHGFVALQGLLLFCLNYVLVYHGEGYISSGLAAVAFTSMLFFNILGNRVFFGVPLGPRILLGALMGCLGIGLVFWPELRSFEGGADGAWGLGLLLGAALAASLGNMVAVRNSRARLPVTQTTAYAMVYGGLFMAVAALAAGRPFGFDASAPYLLSFLYLTVFASVATFLLYFTLLGRIGAERAGYMVVLIPIVALVASSLFETFHWRPLTLLGVGLSLAGAVIVLYRPRPAPPAGTPVRAT